MPQTPVAPNPAKVQHSKAQLQAVKQVTFTDRSQIERSARLAAWAHAERIHAAFGALAVSNVRSQPVFRHRKAPLAALHACSAAAMSPACTSS